MYISAKANTTSHLENAYEVVNKEIASIKRMLERLDEAFNLIVDKILSTDAHIIICGMGKSGLVGKKIAATLSSTGTTSFFIHPAEAYHGDLGMIRPNDIFLALSNSGETEEIIRLISFLKDNGNAIISMTGNPQSTLAKHADYHLDISVDSEACPLSLAPTSSTTNTLVMGDALAVALMKARNFKPEDFARFHPGGHLGRRLLTCVGDVMRTVNLPIVKSDHLMKSVVHVMTMGRLGIAVVKDNHKVLGVITDGDLRRAMEDNGNSFLELKAENVMTPEPINISTNSRLEEAKDIMTDNNITILIVEEHEKFKGIIQLFDCSL